MAQIIVRVWLVQLQLNNLPFCGRAIITCLADIAKILCLQLWKPQTLLIFFKKRENIAFIYFLSARRAMCAKLLHRFLLRLLRFQEGIRHHFAAFCLKNIPPVESTESPKDFLFSNSFRSFVPWPSLLVIPNTTECRKARLSDLVWVSLHATDKAAVHLSHLHCTVTIQRRIHIVKNRLSSWTLEHPFCLLSSKIQCAICVSQDYSTHTHLPLPRPENLHQNSTALQCVPSLKVLHFLLDSGLSWAFHLGRFHFRY